MRLIASAAQCLFMLAVGAPAVAGCLALGTAMPAAAQAGAGAVYAVTYLDVSTVVLLEKRSTFLV